MSAYRLILNIIAIFISLTLLTACTTDKTVSAIPPNPRLAAKLNVRLGIDYLEHNKIVMAKKTFINSLREAPNIAASWYGMAYFLEATGRKQEAEKYYRRAIEVEPDSGEAHNNYGTYLCRTARYREGIQQFLIAIRETDYLAPAEAYENAGLCALLMHDNKLAEQYFIQAINNNPDSFTSLFELASINVKYRKLNLAKRYLNQILRFSKPTAETKKLERLIQRMRSRNNV